MESHSSSVSLPSPEEVAKGALGHEAVALRVGNRPRNGRYYVRTFAGGKEKWTSLKTKLLTVARNRMKDHVDAAERQRTTGNTSEAVGRLTFGEAIATYREQLQEAAIRPNTKAFREAGLKLVLRSWENVETLNVRRITSKMVEEWLSPENK